MHGDSLNATVAKAIETQYKTKEAEINNLIQTATIPADKYARVLKEHDSMYANYSSLLRETRAATRTCEKLDIRIQNLGGSFTKLSDLTSQRLAATQSTMTQQNEAIGAVTNRANAAFSRTSMAEHLRRNPPPRRPVIAKRTSTPTTPIVYLKPKDPQLLARSRCLINAELATAISNPMNQRTMCSTLFLEPESPRAETYALP